MSFTKEQSSVGAHCPFCGDERNIVEIGVPFDDGICHVECARCGAHGPVESAEDRAISAWNLRAGGPVERPALNTKQFSREELETLVCLSAFESNPVVRLAQVAAFALAQMGRAEKDERELVERGKDIHTLTCALESERLRAENAEAERDEARRELAALIDWRRTTSLDELVYGTRAMHEVVDLRAERDRLKGELAEAEEAIRSAESIISNSGVNRDVKGAFGDRPAVRRARERGGHG